MKVRTFAALAALPTILLLPRAANAQFRQPDGQVIHAAARLLVHRSAASVARWVAHRPVVAAAAVGLDGRTVSITFRDGERADVLPRLSRTVRMTATVPVRSHLRAAVQGAARAAVWEPFATELGLGSHAGDPEVGALQRAGFTVDQAYDASVSVQTMTTLPQYNVVYMHTHSGVDSSGRGILATGQLADNDPSVAPLLADGSVVIVGVAGSNSNYYAITSTFVRSHLGPLPSNQLLFMNGCALLASTEFWNALQSQGAGVLVSWNADATAQDDFLSGAAFFNQMAQGQSVHDALQTLYAAGYGKSQYNGQTATLSSLGNDGITLQAAAGGQAAPATSTPPPAATSTSAPRPTATSTPRPTATRTSTPRPTATRTPMPTATSIPAATDTPVPTATNSPAPLNARLSGHVKPGNRETVSVTSAPNLAVSGTVVFPNGDVKHLSATTDGSGAATLDFVQPASKITHRRTTASVTLTAAGMTWEGTYTIGYGRIDLSVQPRRQAAGKQVTLWVHTSSRTEVIVTLHVGVRTAKTLHARTGTKGWAHMTVRLARSWRGRHVVARADAKRHGKRVHTSSSFDVTA